MILSFIKIRSLCDSYWTICMWPPWGRGDICFIGLPKVSPKGSHLCLCCARSCPTLCDPMDHSPPGPWSMGFSRQESWSGMPLSPLGVFPTQGSHPYPPRLLLCRWILHPKPPGKPRLCLCGHLNACFCSMACQAHGTTPSGLERRE